jgi:hypothetical protein
MCAANGGISSVRIHILDRSAQKVRHPRLTWSIANIYEIVGKGRSNAGSASAPRRLGDLDAILAPVQSLDLPDVGIILRDYEAVERFEQELNLLARPENLIFFTSNERRQNLDFYGLRATLKIRPIAPVHSSADFESLH